MLAQIQIHTHVSLLLLLQVSSAIYEVSRKYILYSYKL
jgi:hypothetical protein